MFNLALRALFPLTTFKNAPNPKFVQNLSQRLFLEFQSGVKNLSKIENGNFRTNFDTFLTNSYFARPQKTFVGFFLRVCLGIGEFFSGLRFSRNEARKLLKKFGENSEQNSGQNSGRKFEKFGELSFCDFSDLTNSSPPDWNPPKTIAGTNFGQIWGSGVFECCKGKKGSQISLENFNLA